MQRTRYICKTQQRLQRQPAEPNTDPLELTTTERVVLDDLVARLQDAASTLGRGVLAELLRLEADSFRGLAR